MASAATTETDEAAPAPGGKKKKLIIIVVALLLIAGGAYWFVLKPKPAEAGPEPGEVVAMEAIQINLDNGHYLRLGLALQLTADVAHAADGSKALDAAISVFSGQRTEDLNDPKKREALKEKLLEELEHDYHGDVMDVYFTDFVTQ
jgi:flagellar FliL protein